MTPHEARIRALVAGGQITQSEGARLVDALHRDAAGWTVLLNPFDRLSSRVIWMVASATFVASLGLSRIGTRFDGALDLHRPETTIPWGIALFDQINAVGLTALTAWLVSLAAARRGRFVDFVMTIAAARAPLVVIALVTHALMPPASEIRALVLSGAAPGPAILAASILNLPVFLWFLMLLYRAFAVSSGLRGLRAGVSFGITVIVAEGLSKAALALAGRGFTWP
jgi:hypothetical protein